MLGLHIAAIIGVVMVVVLSASYTIMHGQSREPPSVSSKIPLVGHLMGSSNMAQDILACYGELAILSYRQSKLTQHMRQ